ncbi:MAG: ATP-binding protein [Candidatus Methanoplasma sp.]|jgi:predicted AAA+ superfamily ATPase|nr:ATP-binding protein [Candidatus Methanoplasma sp.]
MLKRKITEGLVKWKNDPEKKSLLVKGARQVGKTFIIDDFARKNYEVYVYINFELAPKTREIFAGDLDTGTLTREIDYRFNTRIVPGKTLIFLDEIQSCPPARTAMKSFTLDKQYDVIASGSLLGLNYKDVPSYPVGYEEQMTLHPMDFEEFLWAMGVGDDKISEVSLRLKSKEPLGNAALDMFDGYFRQFMAVGGMPDVVRTYAKTRDLDQALSRQRAIVETYRDDIAKYAYGRDKSNARLCLDSIPAQIGKRFKISEATGKSNVGMREYGSGLEWLYDSGITQWCYNVSEPALPLSVNRRFNVFKLYMWDTGLLASMMEGGLAYSLVRDENHVNRGKIAENAIAGVIGGKEIMITYFEKKGNLEVDFILNIGNQVTAVEVKSGNNAKSKSLDSVMSDRHNVPRGIKLERTDTCVDEKGVEHYPLFAAAFIFPDNSPHRPWVSPPTQSGKGP